MRSEIKLAILIFYIGLIGGLGFLPFYISGELETKKARVYFFDVGQGDSTLIVTPQKHKILIDGGPDNRVLYSLGKYLNFFDRHLDLVILAHNHADHFVGLIEVIKRYRVDRLMVPADECLAAECTAFFDLAKEMNIELVRADHPGTMVLEKDMTLDFIMAQKAGREKDVNDQSLVFKFSAFGQEALFMGDYEKEEDLPADSVKAQIIKIGHHGAAKANDCDFLRAVGAPFAVIQVGTGNKYGHPHPKTLACLNELSYGIRRTDLSGDIIFSIDGRAIVLDNK